ncbi:MAG: anthranilate phosphoribosyltransferase [Chloroherpetonaceae bacterium]|nr:anthranilate phosphoribosyltransferase [Chloroherpetonaceae bacterium]MDW8437267.1 anthranilate phosphoribosyltransferase [Chloroherpetonaceae bacterium]
MSPKEAVVALINGMSLTSAQMESMVYEIMDGHATDAVIAAILVLLRQKGETIEEIYGAVNALMNRVEKIDLHPEAIDTCGTGGDASGTFNISTVASIIANAAGAKIAKHGNRSISSQSGSADVLEGLGLNVNLSPEQTKAVFERTHYAFLYAPNYHKSMKAVSKARRELGIRTIFNMVGPLANPAGVHRQLVGVYDKELTGMFAQVLRQRGAEHCLVVNGITKEGFALDEPNICGATYVSELKNASVTTYTIHPEDFGFKRRRLEELQGGSLQESVDIVWRIVENRAPEAMRDAAIYASGMAIYVGGKANSMQEGFEKAKEVLETGKAKEALERLIEAHRAVSATAVAS